ncbi:ribosome maturation factor RimM [soil metagenome]
MQLLVARIGKPHGVRGELTVEVRTDDPELRLAAGAVLATEPAERGPLTVARSWVHSGRWIVAFDGVGDRGQADALRNTLLLVDTVDLPPIADPEEFYDHQLIGLAARHLDGTLLGTVGDVVHGPAGDLLVITAGDDREVLIPFRRDMVPTVDVHGGYVEVRPPEGLLEL